MVLLDNNGEPKVFQHESSFLKKGKLMDYESLHAFVTECLVNEYCERKYEAVCLSNQEEEKCDFAIKMASGRTICCKVVLSDESFSEIIPKTDFTSLFSYCRKVKGYPRLYVVSAWCFATPEGSKMIHGSSFAFKVDSISLLDKNDEPAERVRSEESLIKAFADSWNERDVSILNGILSSHVHYCSSFVFDEIRGRQETTAYLGDIFKRIKAANGKSQLSLCRNRETGELMLADISKNGVFSFLFQDSRISEIRLRPLERSQIEFITFSESVADTVSVIQSVVTETKEEPLTDISDDNPVEELPLNNEPQNNSVEIVEETIKHDMAPITSVQVIENPPVVTKPTDNSSTQFSSQSPDSQRNTRQQTNLSPNNENVVKRVSKQSGSHNKWWIMGLSYLLGLVVTSCAIFLYMKGEVEWSKEEITSQIDILKTDKHIACLVDENGSPRYKKEDNVPSGEFYARHKSFYSTGKTDSWYYRVIEQTTPTTFVYSIMSPHGIGFTSPTGYGIDQRFNELKRDIRDDISKNSIISDNNSYLINSMLNAKSKYHSVRRIKDDSKSTEWKFENDSDSYGLYYWEDRWKCDVIQNDNAIWKDAILYTGVVFLIVALILTIVFMALPAFRPHSKD